MENIIRMILGIIFLGFAEFASIAIAVKKFRNYRLYKSEGYETNAEIISFSEYIEKYGRSNQKYYRMEIKYFNGEEYTQTVINSSRGRKYRNSDTCPVICIKGNLGINDIFKESMALADEFSDDEFKQNIDTVSRLIMKTGDYTVYLKEDAHFLLDFILLVISSIVILFLIVFTIILYIPALRNFIL